MSEERDIFKSVPAEGAIQNDWVDETLVLDLTNSIGERFHFEIQPGEVDNLKARSTDAPGSKDVAKATIVNMFIGIAVQDDGYVFTPVPLESK